MALYLQVGHLWRRNGLLIALMCLLFWFVLLLLQMAIEAQEDPRLL